MRRDICYYFAADVQSVYQAYLAAATNQQFRRECKKEPYHTLTFGLNFSMKYNMNGGSCILHFIPYQGGTAVDLRFVIAQLVGARYERYAQDLTGAAAAVLRLPAQPLKLDIGLFMDERNKVTAQAVPAAAPAPAAAPSLKGRTCRQCGAALSAEAAFCAQCGAKAETGQHYCSRCGKPAAAEADFCIHCGNKL